MAGKRFHFKLETVLHLRRHESERARQTLLDIQAAIRRQDECIEQARYRLDALIERGPQGNGPFALRQFDAFRRQAQQAFDQHVRDRATLVHQEAEARKALMGRRQDEEALQTLRDEQQAAFTRQQQQAEADFLDEQALSGYYRKQQSASY